MGFNKIYEGIMQKELLTEEWILLEAEFKDANRSDDLDRWRTLQAMMNQKFKYSDEERAGFKEEMNEILTRLTSMGLGSLANKLKNIGKKTSGLFGMEPVQS